MDMDQVKQTFITECQELLAAMEEALLGLEAQPDPAESINAIFRAVHTIKGSAGLFGLDPIVRFAHAVESVMDRVRGGQLALDGDLVGLLLACHDHLVVLIQEGTDAEGQLSPELGAEGDRLLEALVPWLKGEVATAAIRPEPTGHPAAGRDHWHLSVRFAPTVLQTGMDPLSFVRYLGTLGRMVHMHALLEGLPAGEAFDPEQCYLGLEMDLETDADRKTLEDVFEFVREESQVRLIPPQAKVEAYLALIRELPDEEHLLGEILVAGGCITEYDLAEALRVQREAEDGRKVGTILVQDQDVPAPVVAAALEKQKKAQDRQAGELKIVKVSADKLDKLVDLVGELVIAGASAQTRAAGARDGSLLESLTVVNKLVEEIRDNALSLRMVQIGETFARFRRVVRDVSKELGKAIDLEVQGAETELDKSIVEKLADPLMHIVRNAIDHGIETLEVRRARGKPDTGSLALNAFHESGSIVIEVSDDGGGLDRARILRKAVERGLVQEGAELSDAEINAMIFEPGFSTAAAVTNLSGRGVGMDVVRRNIDELRGTVEVESYEGAGTTIRLRLPLTLAIIDGFMVTVGEATYVVPLDMIIECLDLGPFLESEENHLINLRGEVLPFLRLREVLGSPGERPARERVVVVQFGETRAGIVVDRLLGEFQTVIKPLGSLFQHLRGVGGSTILGSGKVALVLDVPELVQLAVGGRSQPGRILPALAQGS
ncbi:chemotaxis protein CheA [Mesoterricola sediminis]|uniref:Chemotaxis protein CheA n=1 Tax=Mesoterricola sediminis TaxID=2927980 RepID=A0AA48KAX7_9BACT|nr:chemotaxis protein CheA [Mesoterricola sediminis]BDU75529.1 chemotaxis protein CheA [Mesoterricola sediminis]